MTESTKSGGGPNLRNLLYTIWTSTECVLYKVLFNRVTLIAFYAFWFLFGVLVLRKTQNAITAVRYVKTHGETVSLSSIEESREFADLIDTLDRKFSRPPAIFLLNQYALNMTDNFLCNTATLDGAHERFIFVTLDTVARDTIKKRWPEIQQFHWPTPSLYVSCSCFNWVLFFRTMGLQK